MKILFSLCLLLSISFAVMGQDQKQLHNIWVLEKIRGGDFDYGSGKQPRLEIYVEDLRFLGNSGCNDYSGTIQEIEGDKIVFGPVAMTKKFCQDMAELESTFMKALEEVRFWSVDGNGMLSLLDEGKEPIMLFGRTD